MRRPIDLVSVIFFFLGGVKTELRANDACPKKATAKHTRNPRITPSPVTILLYDNLTRINCKWPSILMIIFLDMNGLHQNPSLAVKKRSPANSMVSSLNWRKQLKEMSLEDSLSSYLSRCPHRYCCLVYILLLTCGTLSNCRLHSAILLETSLLCFSRWSCLSR